MNFIKYIVIITTLSLTSCARYSYMVPKKEKLKLSIETLNTLEKTFSNTSYKDAVKKDDLKPNKINLSSVLSISDKTIYCERYSLKFITNDTLLIKDIDSTNKVIFNKKLKGKLKNNGFFHLENPKVVYNGVPYILGGSSSKKTRVGFSIEGDLIVQKAVDHSGAFLLVISSGHSYNTVTYFKEIK